jgi:glycosyltransferase involved in cell wall biosynthesis
VYKKKILWFATRYPYPNIGGDVLLTYKHLQGLSKWSDVYLFSLDEYDNFNLENNKKLIRETGINDSFCFKLDKKKTLLNSARTFFSNIPAQCYYYWDKKAFNYFNKIINEINPDIIIFQTVRTYFYFKNINHNNKYSFLVDAISNNYNAALDFVDFKTKIIYKNELKKLLNVEKNMIESSKKTFFVSDRDIKWEEKSHINTKNCYSISNGVDLNYFEYKKPNLNSNYITFFGNMRTVANNDSALFLIKDIFPKIKKEIINAKIKIVGINPSKELLSYHNNKDIIITGKVNDIKKELYDSRIIVSPLRIGAGLQNKVLEAAALGVPQVISKLAFEGVSFFKKDTDILVSENEKMPDIIVSIFNNNKKLNNLSINARNVIENNYVWENAYKKISSLIR